MSHETAEARQLKLEPMLYHEMARIRAAAFRATRLYPGPVGELCSRELLSWEEFGYRLGGSQLIMRVTDHILKTPLPEPVTTVLYLPVDTRQ